MLVDVNELLLAEQKKLKYLVFSIKPKNKYNLSLGFCYSHRTCPYLYIYLKLCKCEQKVDAVVGDVAIVAKRFEHAEFTQPHAEPGLQMITPVRSKSSNKAWLFMKPFTRAMWILITFINVYNGFVVWFIKRNQYCNELKGLVLNKIGTLLWLAFSTLFSLHGKKKSLHILEI